MTWIAAEIATRDYNAPPSIDAMNAPLIDLLASSPRTLSEGSASTDAACSAAAGASSTSDAVVS
jgi:antirestriction protein